MPKPNNAVWRFFASVKLALITLITLATVSIIGTLIKQGQPPAYYVKEFGGGIAGIFEHLNLTNMYSAWWFVALLGLFAINLLVCSIERLPGVWRQITTDPLDIDLRQLETMGSTLRAETSQTTRDAAERMRQIMAANGWKKPRQAERDGSILYADQKGAWTRLGVYIVHLSILVILVGAIIGSVLGYQAYVFIPEGTRTSNIFLRTNKKPVPLGFELQCDRFEKTYYPNGMIKQYLADLSVFDPDRGDPYRKQVVVNDPLTYRGLAFYVGDGFPMEEYFVLVRNQRTGMEQRFRVPPERDIPLSEKSVSFRIEELERTKDGIALRARFRFDSVPATGSSDFWLNDRGTIAIRQAGEDYLITYRQLYSTLLLVTKDPGVLTIYFGFGLMVVGLAISFFLSHRRIWVHIAPNGKSGARLLIGGSSNKNKPAMSRCLEALGDAVRQDPLLAGRSKKK